MYYCYGQVRSQTAESTTNQAIYNTFVAYTAGDKPVEIRSAAYWGGDANEFYTLALAPPSWSTGDAVNEGTDAQRGANGIIPITGGMKGGLFAAFKKGNIFIPVQLSDSIISPIIVPPYYNLVIYPTTGVINSKLYCAIFGLELEKP